MIVYALLRAIAGVALRWYYSDIEIEGLERLPRRRPLILAVNHPNALVDALLVGWVVPRRVRITAKSTLFRTPLANRLLRWLGVVPLHRASDVGSLGVPTDPARNQDAFRAVQTVLRDGGTVLIFPEGRSHDEPALAPLKSGAARMSLQATESGEVPELAIVPIGLTFERKDAPRTRVLVQIGEPIVMDGWHPPPGTGSRADALTAEIDTRLRAVTLNYASEDDAARAIRLAAQLAALFEGPSRLGVVDRGLGAEARIAQRIDAWAARLQASNPELQARAYTLVRRLDAVQREAAAHGIRMEDIGISLGAGPGLRFLIRESWFVLVGGPIALWGGVNHWLPLSTARALALRSIKSADEPAMRMVVAGAAMVLITYFAQTAAMAALWGPRLALVYLVSLPIAADINFSLSDRLRRAGQRARAFLFFRRHRALHDRLSAELTAVRQELGPIERLLVGDDATRGVAHEEQSPKAQHPAPGPSPSA